METKTCSRCDGSGNYSFNLMYGTVCFKCNGQGVVPASPNKKGIRVTSLINYAVEGDIVNQRGVGVSRVIDVLDGEFTRKEQDTIFGGTMEVSYTRIVRYESLITGKKYRHYGHTPLIRKLDKDGKALEVNKKTGIWQYKKEK